MRTSLPLSFLVAALGTLAGCSDSGDKCPPGDTSAACLGGTANGGTGGQTGGGQGGTSSTGNGGGSSAGNGGGSSGPTVNYGDLFTLSAATGSATALPFSIASSAAIGVKGASFIDKSPMGTTFEVVPSDVAGQICVQGTLGVVPNGDYTNYWGVDFGFNLNQDTAAAGDAGAIDPQPWLPPANVLGFSFIITGGTTGKLRVRIRPSGLNPALETSIYCKDIPAPVKDVPTNVLLTDVKQTCWNPATPVAPATNGFDRISWNLPADVIASQPAPVDFNFCIKDIRPILAAP